MFSSPKKSIVPKAYLLRTAVWLGSLAAHMAAWFGTCRDYYAAAAIYQELSRLSDAELQRRGLNRATLAWDLSQDRHRASRGPEDTASSRPEE
jgi:hypothetical protein